MKKIFILLLLTSWIASSQGQILYFSAGKTISSFLYKNSEGVKLQNLRGTDHNTLCAGGLIPLSTSPLYLSLDATYQKYNAEGSDPVLGNYYAWQGSFLGANLGLDYEIKTRRNRVNDERGLFFMIKTAVSAEFLLFGTQNINNMIYDLKGAPEFDKPFYFLRGGFSVNYRVSRVYSVYLQYMGGMSFLIGNYTNKERLQLATHTVSVGMAFDLSNRMR